MEKFQEDLLVHHNQSTPTKTQSSDEKIDQHPDLANSQIVAS
jgi:hypothetical protein